LLDVLCEHGEKVKMKTKRGSKYSSSPALSLKLRAAGPDVSMEAAHKKRRATREFTDLSDDGEQNARGSTESVIDITRSLIARLWMKLRLRKSYVLLGSR
jgi:hypothetical protein